mgnify:FL=1
MPELPEVEILRRYFEEAALNKNISGCDFYDDLDKIFKSDRKTIQKALTGSSFTKTQRTGKYLFARIEKGSWLHLHFGMTGNLELFRGEALPKYSRFVINFNDGDRLAFRDLRKFGVVQIVESPDAYRKAQKIGQDFLHIDLSDFRAGLANRKVAVKTALLDQKHFAGIGNWIADEMLFDAGIHPAESCVLLRDDDFRKLFEAGQKIIKAAIEADTHYGDFPKHFFVNYRKPKALHPDHPDSPVKRLIVGGRGTFIVPEKQKLKS